MQTNLIAKWSASEQRCRDEAMRLDMIIEEGVEVSYATEMDVVVNKAIDILAELVKTLEAIETPEDAENSYSTLNGYARALRELEGNDPALREQFQEQILSSDYAVSLAQRIEAVLDSFDEGSEMGIVFQALEPLDGDRASVQEITPEQMKALENFRVLLEQSITLFGKLKTTNDVDKYADEIRSLAEKEREVRAALPGSQGEMLIESNRELVKLLEQLGGEQMRIFEDPELSAKIGKLFGGE